MKKTLIIAFVMLTALRMLAAEQFVVFQPQADVISLNGDCISVDSREHSCVKRAVENLRQDFIRVLDQSQSRAQAPGAEPSEPVPLTASSQPSISVGT